jgi:hypothetical protein
MRCRTSERRISDSIDGSLSRRRSRRLENHLASCASCREYRARLLRIQEETARISAPDVPSGYWEDSRARLRESLESIRPASSQTEIKRPRRRASIPSRRLAWAGAIGLVAAAAAILVLSVRTRVPVESLPLSHEEAANRLVALIGSDAEVETAFVEMIQASILEVSDVRDGDVARLLYGSNRFLDSLSDDEMEALNSHLARELDI